MCHIDTTEPLVFPLRRRTKNGVIVLDYTFLLGKVTEKRNGEHVSSRGFTWPVGHAVHDANAVIGHHERALHYAASPKSAHNFLAYGSHRLGVLPAHKLWRSIEEAGHMNRCWHSSGGVVILCMDCDNYQLDVLDNPDFWKDLKRPGRLPSVLTFSGLLAADSVWHEQVALVGE
jgi:hypothetical protein